MSKNELKICIKCNRSKTVAEFYVYPNGSLYKVCKECHKARVKANSEKEAIEAGHRAYKEGLIKYEEIEDAIDLYKSCRSRIHSCKYGIGIYQNVDCAWDDPYEFMKDILTKRDTGILFWDLLWDVWKEQRRIYLNTGDENEKPELDRAFGYAGIGYQIGTVQCLSDWLNREKAKEVTALRIRLYRENEFIGERHFAYISKAKKWLQSETNHKCSLKKIKNNIDKGRISFHEFEFEIHSLDYMMREYRRELMLSKLSKCRLRKNDKRLNFRWSA
jgi:hypothetical protein